MKIYKIKRVPEVVKEHFERNYKDCELNYYYYYRNEIDKTKVYGCEVIKDGHFYSNFDQGSEDHYELVANLPF